MNFMVGDRVRIISQRRPAGFGAVKGYEGIISHIWSDVPYNIYKDRNVEIEFFDDELRNFVKDNDILWETRELELI